MTDRVDVVVIGAGAAGMMCAAVAGRRGRSVVLVDHARKLAEKIRISGGGRCNFTNRDVAPRHFAGEDPQFAATALAAYGPRDFTALVEMHGIRWHEKHRGQLFCDDASQRIIDLLVAECAAGGVRWRRPARVAGVARDGDGWRVDCDGGAIVASKVVLATGGLSIPKIGATDFAHRTARRLGLRVVEPRPALVPLVFEPVGWAPFSALSGVALEADVATDDGDVRFREDLLFTHRGLSGPAALQISTFWRPGRALAVDLAPGGDLGRALVDAKGSARHDLSTALSARLPRRLVSTWLAEHGIDDRRLAEIANARLATLAAGLADWRPRPSGTEGWAKAEVTSGGVATDELVPGTLEARRMPGLHVVGEAVDVTGWLGGYNFQWAWASGVAAGRAV